MSGGPRHTLSVYGDTKERFENTKPYDSMSADEFVDTLLNHWRQTHGSRN